MTFGAFIGTRRKAAKLNLRDTANISELLMDTSATLSKGGVPHQKDSLWIEFPPSWSWTSRSMNCFWI